MLELSIWTGYYRDIPPEDAVKRLVDNGWRYMELCSDHGEALLARGNLETVGREFRRYADDIGAIMPQGHLWLKCDIATYDQDQVIDKLKGWIDLFQAIGIPHAVLHAGGQELKEQGCAPEKIHELRLRALQQITDYMRGSDMMICLENTVTGVPDADGLIELIETIGSPNLGICLDTGHLNRSGGSQREFIHKAKPYLNALHIDDNEGKTDQHLMPYGRGTIDWNEVVTALKEIEYQGIFNLELPGEAKCPLAIRDIKLDYLKKIINIMLNGIPQ